MGLSVANKTIGVTTSNSLRHNGCASFYASKGEEAFVSTRALNAAGTELLDAIALYNWVVWESED